MGQSLAHRPAFLGGFGRDFTISSTARVGAEFTTGRLLTGDLVCFQDVCDSRELAQFGTLTITGVLSSSARTVAPYVRANVGAWLGRDNEAASYESSRETGLALAGEAGVRLGQFAAGVRLDQLSGVRRGTLRIASVVARVSF